MNVPASDLNVTIASGVKSGEMAIVLYDNVPGGAGLVAQLEQALADLDIGQTVQTEQRQED